MRAAINNDEYQKKCLSSSGERLLRKHHNEIMMPGCVHVDSVAAPSEFRIVAQWSFSARTSIAGMVHSNTSSRAHIQNLATRFQLQRYVPLVLILIICEGGVIRLCSLDVSNVPRETSSVSHTKIRGLGGVGNISRPPPPLAQSRPL